MKESNSHDKGHASDAHGKIIKNNIDYKKILQSLSPADRQKILEKLEQDEPAIRHAPGKFFDSRSAEDRQFPNKASKSTTSTQGGPDSSDDKEYLDIPKVDIPKGP